MARCPPGTRRSGRASPEGARPVSHAVSGDAPSPGLVKAHGGAVVIPGSSKQEFGAGRSSGVVLAESRSAVISTCALQRGGVPHGTPLQSEGSERRDGRRPGRPVTSASAPAPASGHTPGPFRQGPASEDEPRRGPAASPAASGVCGNRLQFFSCHDQKLLNMKMHICIFIKNKNTSLAHRP